MPFLFDELRRFFTAALLRSPVREDPDTPAQRLRRRVVVALTLLIGTGTLGWALAVQPGDPLFYVATCATAAVWVLGAIASGRVHRGIALTRNGHHSRGILQGFVLGALLLAVFVGGAVVVARIPALSQPVEQLLHHATYGSLGLVAVITVLNGLAEELFFRGAVYASLPRHFASIGSTLLYAASTALIGVPLLTFAALCLGALTAAQRRVTGGVLGPMTSHVTWSLGMLFLLPMVLRSGG